MKVKELIQDLMEFDLNADVWFNDGRQNQYNKYIISKRIKPNPDGHVWITLCNDDKLNRALLDCVPVIEQRKKLVESIYYLDIKDEEKPILKYIIFGMIYPFCLDKDRSYTAAKDIAKLHMVQHTYY